MKVRRKKVSTEAKWIPLEGKSTEMLFCSFFWPHFPCTWNEINVLSNWHVWQEEPNMWGTAVSFLTSLMVWPILKALLFYHVIDFGWQTLLRTGWQLWEGPRSHKSKPQSHILQFIDIGYQADILIVILFLSLFQLVSNS